MARNLAEKTHLGRQVAMARLVCVFIALTSMAQWRHAIQADQWLLFGYFLVALFFAAAERLRPQSGLRLPVWVDVATLAVFLVLSSSFVAILFVSCFAAFAVATYATARRANTFVGITVLAATLRLAIATQRTGGTVTDLIVLSAALAAGCIGAAWVGSREKEEEDRRFVLEKIAGHLQFGRGLSESVRQALGEVAQAFDGEQACLAILEDELERIFVWRVRPTDQNLKGPETLPMVRADAYLLDCMEVTLCWRSLDGRGEGFGWDRRTGQYFANPPRPPESMKKELGVRALLAATLEDASGRPVGRLMVFNSRKKWSPGVLRWFERVARHLGPPLENVYQMRHARARAVEGERSRISRDLHDGILQTLLSLQIQLEVMRRNLPNGSKQFSEDIGNLQKTVRHESDELRRMVTEMRPLRIESADLRELMVGFAERYQTESNLVVDLFIEDRDLRAPDRVCREIFQIYRESLNNIKKHAHASHVVVKLGQDDSKVSLTIDDNGLGFSFSGQFSSEDLDRLRLGPISIKERTRGVGGNLTVESNPGHGARLTIEIPLS
jgi:signal transduction histidine kinase